MSLEPTILPDTEANITRALTENATELAKQGHLAVGYTLIWTGLQRARGFAADGVPWGAELVRYWEQELDDYCERFGVLGLSHL